MRLTARTDGRPDNKSTALPASARFICLRPPEPAFYSAMFELGCCWQSGAAGGERVGLAIIRAASERVGGPAQRAAAACPGMMALHIWSLSHGIVFVVRARRCAATADVGGRPAGSRRADLPQGPWLPADQRPAAAPRDICLAAPASLDNAAGSFIYVNVILHSRMRELEEAYG